MPQALLVSIIVRIVIAVIVALVLSFISKALAPKPKTPFADFSAFSSTGRDRLRQVQQPISSREIVYGEMRKSGVLVHVETTSNNKYLHMVLAVASHEVESIPVVFINSDPVYDDELSVDGIVNTGKYDDRVRIKKHLGTAAQTADTDLTAASSQWTSDHRLRGIAYVYVRLEFDTDVFPTSIPNISAWIRGKKCKEIRDSAEPSEWTTNPALIARDYIVTSTNDLGLGFDETEVDDTYLAATANTCDEMVTVADIEYDVDSVNTTDDCVVIDETKHINLQTGDRVDVESTGSIPGGLGSNKYIVFYKPFVSESNLNPQIRFADSYEDALTGTYITITDAGSGNITVTKRAEPRYTCNGVCPSDRAPHDNLGDIISSMGGRASYVGGVWKIRPAVYESPSVAFDESDIIDTIAVQTKYSRRDRFNAIKGIYTSPADLGVLTEYPAVTNSNYETEDNGERVWTEYDLPFTTRPHTCQRLAKIELERHRQMIRFEGLFKLTALEAQPGDVVQLSIDVLGWSNKEFEVIEWEFISKESQDNIFFAIRLTLQETASGVFDWNSGEETAVDLAPNTNLPNPTVVGSPTGVSVSTDTTTNISGTQIHDILINWNPVTDVFVLQGGHVSVQYRKSDDKTDFTTNDYQWIKTADSALDEYYLVNNDSAQSNPNVAKPWKILLNDVDSGEEDLGSLSAGTWSYGDNDSLGFDTIYVRMSDDTDPDNSANTVEAKYFESLPPIDGDQVEARIPNVQFGTDYDLRVRNVNYLGARSSWVTVLDYSVGSPAVGVVGNWDFGFVYNPEIEDLRWGGVLEAVDSSYEFGSDSAI